jgi:hypothetical protein
LNLDDEPGVRIPDRLEPIMGDAPDFEQAWQRKLGAALDRVAGEATRHLVLEGGQHLSDESSRDEIILWTQEMLARAEGALDKRELAEVFTACACHYPGEDLLALREDFARNGDLHAIMDQLQARFEQFLTSVVELPGEHIEQIIARGWGLAGRLEGDTIIATKIPKSGYLREYMQEPDPDRRRALYCHCPRVRAAAATNEGLSPTYCYCGAGYYRDIWETILAQPVTVEVVSSVLAGDDTCTIAIHLPPGITSPGSVQPPLATAT